VIAPVADEISPYRIRRYHSELVGERIVNVASVDRIIYAIFQRLNLEWKDRTLKLFTQAA
jgi:hypothetical protein